MSILYLAHRFRGHVIPSCKYIALGYPLSSRIACRSASLNSAINRGLRKSSRDSSRRPASSPTRRSDSFREREPYNRSHEASRVPDRWMGRGSSDRSGQGRSTGLSRQRFANEDQSGRRSDSGRNSKPRIKNRAERRAEIYPVKAEHLREEGQDSWTGEPKHNKAENSEEDEWTEVKSPARAERGFRDEQVASRSTGYGPWKTKDEGFAASRSRFTPASARRTGGSGPQFGKDGDADYWNAGMRGDKENRRSAPRYGRDDGERRPGYGRDQGERRPRYGRDEGEKRPSRPRYECQTSFDRDRGFEDTSKFQNKRGERSFDQDRESRKPFQAPESDSTARPFRARARRETDIGNDSSRQHLAPAFDSHVPLSVPHTTSASEFLYGTSVVKAALSSDRPVRRKLYKFYICDSENRQDYARDSRLEKLAEESGVEVIRASGDFVRTMDKMASGRPHNGYILEASPLPRLPIQNLGVVDTVNDEPGFSVVPDTQTREEAAINGNHTFISLPSATSNNSRRMPLVLLLDCIEDPGNLGGIIRTASFLGVSAIAISVHGSAHITPVVLKASSGACESTTLFTVAKPADFVRESQKAGWKIFAAVPPGRAKENVECIQAHELSSSMRSSPALLMLGGEGSGLRKNLREKADVEIYVSGGTNAGHSSGVDSLNVSVAAGILCEAFMRTIPNEEMTSRPERDLF